MVVYGTRTVQLARGRDGSLGFSVRGGREHGTGVFISQVEPSSDAQLHGLKVGDEVLKVNGLSVQRATHREVVSVIRNTSFVQLRVRDVGLLPVKDYPGAAVAWRTVETIETRIYIGLTGQTTLGCSICKGPPGWPGVFVQSTKQVGLAREVGLRPGDQILQCNGVSFVDIDFAKAVYILKLAQHLDLTIRRGVAAELFAARSSGYSSNNCTDCSGTESTASSVTAGSPPPPPALPSGVGRAHRAFTGGATAEHRRAPRDGRKPINGVNSRPLSELPETEELPSSQLTVDRHRRWQDIEAEWAQSEQDEQDVEHEQQQQAAGVRRLHVSGGAGRPPEPPPPPPPGPPPLPPLQRGQGDGSSEETAAAPPAADCSDRSAARQESTVPPPPPMMSTSTLIPTYRRLLPLTSEGVADSEEPRVQQHDQLMEEFKEAHRKMFAHKEDEIGSSKPERQGGSPPLHSSPPSGGLKRSKPVHVPPRPLPSLSEREVIIESRCEGRQMRQGAPPPPPPPPPPPEEDKKVDSITLYTTPTLAKLAQTQQPTKVTRPLAYAATNGVGGSSAGRGQAGVETESLDSFTLEHPPHAAHKPPPTYFDGAPRKKDVLVSIGAYGDSRPAPSRLQFLSSARRPDSAEEADGGKFERVTMELQHELVQTLTRSNLRHRTGSVDNLLDDGGATTRRTVLDKYGSVLNISDSGADSGPGGGILKNGTARSSNKSISFGKTTMIGDVPVTVL